MFRLLWTCLILSKSWQMKPLLLAYLLAYFERTRTPLTNFIHSFRFPMMLFRPAMLKPVSFRSWSTYVVAGLPLFITLGFKYYYRWTFIILGSSYYACATQDTTKHLASLGGIFRGVISHHISSLTWDQDMCHLYQSIGKAKGKSENWG